MRPAHARPRAARRECSRVAPSLPSALPRSQVCTRRAHTLRDPPGTDSGPRACRARTRWKKGAPVGGKGRVQRLLARRSVICEHDRGLCR